ncbi:hypothetical protein GmRootV59_12260 [Variovorax sp. V59]
MRAPKRSDQRSRSAARTMAAMLEPPPEIRITMFFMGGRDYLCSARVVAARTPIHSTTVLKLEAPETRRAVCGGTINTARHAWI